MLIRNYRELEAVEKSIHGGDGLARSHKLYSAEELASGLRYVAFTELPPGASIGEHHHQDMREEFYVIQSGSGLLMVDGQTRRVKTGDVILTQAGSRHGLRNDSSETLEVFVFWAV